MKLGSFSVGMPLYEVESEVTYQTVRTPTVFERTVMKLCGSYRATPGAAQHRKSIWIFGSQSFRLPPMA